MVGIYPRLTSIATASAKSTSLSLYTDCPYIPPHPKATLVVVNVDALDSGQPLYIMGRECPGLAIQWADASHETTVQWAWRFYCSLKKKSS